MAQVLPTSRRASVTSPEKEKLKSNGRFHVAHDESRGWMDDEAVALSSAALAASALEEKSAPPLAVMLPASMRARRKFRRRQRHEHEKQQSPPADENNECQTPRPELCAEFAARRANRGWPTPCGLPLQLLQQKIVDYNAACHPLVALLAQAVGSTVEDLPQLHLDAEVAQWLSRPNMKTLGLNPVDRRFKAAGGFRRNLPLNEAYMRFLREVVLPQLPDPEGWLYQKEPNLRCHLPGTGRHLVLRHCDADYFHQPHELNFWLPCTSCYGSNTLWTESAPGAGDYRPVELQVGQLLRFYGHQCDHYSLPNESGVTRLSLDFRVVPRSHFCEAYPGSHMGDCKARFGIGGFFGVLGPDGHELKEGSQRDAVVPVGVA